MSYVELLGALELSCLVKKGTVLVVEYPKAEAGNLMDEIGRLEKVKDRVYGRTLVAVYESRADTGVGCSWENVLTGKAAEADDLKRRNKGAGASSATRRGTRGRRRMGPPKEGAGGRDGGGGDGGGADGGEGDFVLVEEASSFSRS